jgi:hypothetical protein
VCAHQHSPSHALHPLTRVRLTTASVRSLFWLVWPVGFVWHHKQHSNAALMRTYYMCPVCRADSRSLGKPLGRTTGWSLLDSQTAPSVGPVQDNAIELGEHAHP